VVSPIARNRCSDRRRGGRGAVEDRQRRAGPLRVLAITPAVITSTTTIDAELAETADQPSFGSPACSAGSRLFVVITRASARLSKMVRPSRPGGHKGGADASTSVAGSMYLRASSGAIERPTPRRRVLSRIRLVDRLALRLLADVVREFRQRPGRRSVARFNVDGARGCQARLAWFTRGRRSAFMRTTVAHLHGVFHQQASRPAGHARTSRCASRRSAHLAGHLGRRVLTDAGGVGLDTAEHASESRAAGAEAGWRRARRPTRWTSDVGIVPLNRGVAQRALRAHRTGSTARPPSPGQHTRRRASSATARVAEPLPPPALGFQSIVLPAARLLRRGDGVTHVLLEPAGSLRIADADSRRAICLVGGPMAARGGADLALGRASPRQQSRDRDGRAGIRCPCRSPGMLPSTSMPAFAGQARRSRQESPAVDDDAVCRGCR